ncbi:adenosylcobalamin-dependent ribonucleoside-diphosphate reductase [Thermaerobacter litoralis]
MDEARVLAGPARNGRTRTGERFGGLPTEMGWKIFLDRYAQKDPERAFEPGDLVVLPVVEDRKWSQKEIGRVLAVRGETVLAEILTGPERGRAAEFRTMACDRPVETAFAQVAQRVARAIAAVEPDEARRRRWEGEFARVLGEFRFVPGGRILAGAGTGSELTLYNCYVIPSPHDSRQGIVETLGQMMEIMARGGGVGINVSSLRPFRAPVRSVNGRSSGAVSWMEIYSYATGLIEQAGARRGALMLQLDCRHPDLLEFLYAKRNAGRVENANISVRVTDAFMEAVREDREWTLWFPDTTHPDYDRLWRGDFDDWERRGLPKVVYATHPARAIWRAICESAWASAEPGVVFVDRVEAESNAWYLHRLPCSNPCGEQMLPEWGVCCLGHVHLGRHYDAGRNDVDWEALRQTVRVAVRFLDNVIDATPYFLRENERVQKGERRIGLGTLGLAELLIRLGIRYGSEEAVAFCDRLYRFIAEEAYRASIELAQEKGPFPLCDPEKHAASGFVRRLPDAIQEGILAHGIRNVTLLTQAPTGTVGTMLDTSTGIEPFFAFRYKRRSRLGEAEQEVRLVQEWREQHPGEELPDHFVTAMQLTPEEHVRMQAAIQKWVDASISKTVNCPADWTVEDTERLYRLAYELGCKGITIYRDGSRSEQVLTTDDGKAGRPDGAEKKPRQASPAGTEPFGQRRPHPRPPARKGQTIERPTPLGTAHVTVNAWQDPVSGYHGPMEVYIAVGKAGSEVQAMAEALGRVVSVALQSGVDPRVIARQLLGIGGSSPVGFGPSRVRSVPDAVGQVLASVLEAAEQPLPEGASPPPGPAAEAEAVDLCPQCGAPSLVHQEGCVKCAECGYSRC